MRTQGIMRQDDWMRSIAPGIILLILGLLAVVVVAAFRHEASSYTFSGTSVSSATDSLHGYDTTVIVRGKDMRGLQYLIVVSGPVTSVNGAGNEDSARIVLATRAGEGAPLILLDSINGVMGTGLPDTLTGTLHPNVGDTALRPDLLIITEVTDTLADTVATVDWLVEFNVVVK